MATRENDVWRLPTSVIRDAYLAHAADLKTGDADDRRLARDVEWFVAEMPVALTRRQALAVELRQVLERENGARGAKGTGPAKGEEVLHGARHRQFDEPRLSLDTDGPKRRR